MKLKTKDVCTIALLTALIAVCAHIRVPAPSGVAFTFQTFAILLAGFILGKRNGAIAALLYVWLGVMGVPIFTVGGGPSALFGRTGGFLLSFPVLAYCGGIAAQKENFFWQLGWLIVGTAVNFTSGVLMFAAVTEIGIGAAFMMVALPFLPTEALKIALAFLLGKVIRRALRQSGVLV